MQLKDMRLVYVVMGQSDALISLAAGKVLAFAEGTAPSFGIPKGTPMVQLTAEQQAELFPNGFNDEPLALRKSLAKLPEFVQNNWPSLSQSHRYVLVYYNHPSGGSTSPMLVPAAYVKNKADLAEAFENSTGLPASRISRPYTICDRDGAVLEVIRDDSPLLR